MDVLIEFELAKLPKFLSLLLCHKTSWIKQISLWKYAWHIVYNETWLKDSIHDNEVLPTEIYKTFRLDRSSYTHPPDTTNSRKFRKNGGGVLIGIKHDIDIESEHIPLKCRAEILSIVLTDKTGKKTIICTCYRVGTLGTGNHDRIKDPTEILKRRVHTDFSTGYQWWSLRLAPPNLSFRSGITHLSKMGILCFEKITFIFELASFYVYGACGGGRDFV